MKTKSTKPWYLSTKILVLSGILNGCAITPGSTTDRIVTILGTALIAKSASGNSYNWQQGLKDSQDFTRNAVIQPQQQRVICYRYGNVYNCYFEK